MRKTLVMATLFALLAMTANGIDAQEATGVVILQPDRVFDGEAMHTGWVVVVRGDRIESAGPAGAAPAGARPLPLPGTTLLPGLIEGHSHLLLHPYNETTWNDQVAHEALAYRVARAVNHA